LTVRLWNLTTYANRFILKGYSDQVIGLKQVSADMLASGSLDTTLKLWNISSGALIATLRNHTTGIKLSVDMLNTQIVVSGSDDGSIKLWNVNTGDVLKTIYAGMSIRSMAVLDVSTTSN
jgi:WD40 repeat protein